MSPPIPAPALDALSVLAAVAETGSLGKAAALRGITQPAASMRLRGLERDLGLQLVLRTPSGSTLTAEGRAVLEWAQPVLAAAQTLVRGAEALRHRESGQLRMAASLTVADHLVPTWLVRLHSRAPGVSVALRVGNSEQVAGWVAERSVAFGVVEGPRAPRGMRGMVVGEDELVLVTDPAHRWARRRSPLPPGELAGASLLLRELGSGTRAVAQEKLAAAGITPHIAAELGSTAAIIAAAAAGEAPALVSRLAAASQISAHRLAVIPLAGMDFRRQFRAIWPTEVRLRAPASTLLEITQRRPKPR
ncbi:MAG: LysR family transcriptional regulator [Sciscionella sp.]